MTPTLYYTVGLPASGKTTRARQLVDQNPRMVRVNRDDLRSMFHEGRFSGANEKAVTRAQTELIRNALADGRDVICDDTNLNPRTRNRLEATADKMGARVRPISFTDVPLRVCIKRDAQRERSVGEDVIRGMWEKYLAPPPRSRNGLQTAVIVDVDGTLAIRGDRGPYDWGRVGEDTPNRMVIGLVQHLAREGHAVLVVSGRDGSCYEATYAWLIDNQVPCTLLLMRTAGDMRPDWEVKSEILKGTIERCYDPVLAVDDRQQVVDVWREHGIECWQVAPGRF